ncbi:antiviral reverse transcriptase Drt3b [Flavobacterium fluviatile]|uniref:antiviral reverse transcriptase Drt3b n=1 Tax=Flavobacterium fluviatile TaxID=1862387 RepID=UPI0013D8CBE2|nr:antiviral reverse transcriptase Drt3b [Flavobacterium fluviatile]
MRKKIPIIDCKERVALSDVLPYETPLLFSNRYFYKYLLKREKSEKSLGYKNKKNKAFAEIESILFSREEITRPFIFNINHRVNDFRKLSLIHPSNQLRVIEFYEKYKSLILYYCTISPFSIRRPASVAKFTFYNDLLHKKNQDGDLEHSQIEQDESEYENLKSYFTYQKYSNIHKFFESYQFHRCEKKYSKLLRIDISKCFDSIYTHTISWAILNKQIVKDNVVHSLKTFGGEFDNLMQKLNANETNGIIIGPEFSRIFAEIILQQIDKDIFDKLKITDENGKNLIHKIDYEAFRYVDDYFIFYNNEVDSQRILKEFKLCLSEYKMYVNENKSIVYDKPIITEISLAKQKISDLFNDHLKLIENQKVTEDDQSNPELYFSSNNVITRFKSIVKETGVEYKDIMNYSLAVLDKKTAKLINKFKKEKTENPKLSEKEFEKGFLEILDVAFFLYSVSPRVNSTIKLCLIIDKIICFLKKNKTNNYVEPFSCNHKHNIFKKISDEIFLILQKNKTKDETQVETLYLLIALSQLGREYRLNINILCSYFNIKIHSDNTFEIVHPLNYFSITVLLFYIKDIHMYAPIKSLMRVYILDKFKNSILDKKWKMDTELVLLLMDVLSCPFLNNSIDSIENKNLFLEFENLENAILQPFTALESDNYINTISKISKQINSIESVQFLEQKILLKLNLWTNLYIQELNKDDSSDVDNRKQKLLTFIFYLKNNVIKHVDKHKFKKELLTLVDINDNQVNFIKQEKFWFIKWTEFDFRLELQAKRSQEVY